jgi:hypothetical protein
LLTSRSFCCITLALARKLTEVYDELLVFATTET